MKIEVQTKSRVDGGPEWATVWAEARDDGWYVETSDIDGKGWRLFASKSARGRDVRQLVNKAYDVRY